MREKVIKEICRFVKESPDNDFPEQEQPYFEKPLVGFASAEDLLFTQYKTVIGSFHLTPQELIEKAIGPESWKPVTIICWVLPIALATKMTNRSETTYPSKEWAQTRSFGEKFNVLLRRHMVEYLVGEGYHAEAPQLLSVWKRLEKTPVGIASTWSERHAAYAAGLGTFSLNDALITPKGIAHRLGSVITDLEITPSQRVYPSYRSNCLYFREQSCGLCISRCPAQALSPEGHDKDKCCEHVYGTVPIKVGESYGVPETGCGLCQTKVPCEGKIPVGRIPYPISLGFFPEEP
ncbi:MAG: epoxyqueuosine reductase [Negativicutes bacterium]|nr:epoxyqueuosine reductase [Negativicutes bacterium]